MSQQTKQETEKVKKSDPDFSNEWWDVFEAEDHRNVRKGKPSGGPQLEFFDMVVDMSVVEPTVGQIVKGTYRGSTPKDHLFDVVGYKDQVRVETKPSEDKYLRDTQIGEVVDLIITDITHKKYEIKGSIASLYETKAHQELLELEDDAIVSAKILSQSPGGYEVVIVQGKVSLPGFMPNTLAGINKLYNPESIVGQTMEVIIETYSEAENSYIVSRKKYLQTLIEEEIKLLMTDTLYVGRVTGTTPFGIFVEFASTEERMPCLTGMIHKANVVDSHKERIQEINPGTKIEFYVKEIIKNNKIVLTQILRESLWDTIKPRLEMVGTVRDVKPFGVLINLDTETVGLVHNSEVEKSGKKLNIGDTVNVRVLASDRPNRKIFLTLI